MIRTQTRALLLASLTSAIVSSAAPASELVSRFKDGAAGDQTSYGALLSETGRFVAFSSDASLVGVDSGADTDVFVHDRKKGKVERVTVAPDGSEPSGDCYLQGLSADGRFVCIYAAAHNLVAGESPADAQIVVRDRKKKKNILASRTQAGAPVSGYIYHASMSDNGRYVVFVTNASGVVEGSVNGFYQVYLRDLKAKTTELVSRNFLGAIAGDDCYSPRVSNDGRYVFFATQGVLAPGDGNGAYDVYVRDLEQGTTVLAAPGENGFIDAGAGEFDITPDGRFVAFVSDGAVTSAGTSYRAAYVHDRKKGTILPAALMWWGVPAGGVDPDSLSISDDGKRVAFTSYWSIVEDDPNGGVHDLFLCVPKKQMVSLESWTWNGAAVDKDIQGCAISGDGRLIGFHTPATGVVDEDTLGKTQVYVVKP